MSKKDETQLLIDEPHRYVSPTMAMALGGALGASIVQQLHYWMPKAQTMYEGRHWVYKTYDEWQEEFPYVGKKAIQSAIKNLEDRKVIRSKQLRATKWDRKKYYTIDYYRLHEAINLHFSMDRETDDGETGTKQFEMVPIGASYERFRLVLSTESTGSKSTTSKEQPAENDQEVLHPKEAGDENKLPFSEEDIEMIYDAYPVKSEGRGSDYRVIRKTLCGLYDGTLEPYPEYERYYERKYRRQWPPPDRAEWLLERVEAFAVSDYVRLVSDRMYVMLMRNYFNNLRFFELLPDEEEEFDEDEEEEFDEDEEPEPKEGKPRVDDDDDEFDPFAEL